MLRRQLKQAAAAGVISLTALAGSISWSYFEYLQLNNEATVAIELSDGMNDLQYLTTEYLILRTPRVLKQWQARMQRLHTLLENTSIRDEDVQLLVPEIRTRLTTLESVFDKLVTIGGRGLEVPRARAAEQAIISRLLNQVLALSTIRERVTDIYADRANDLNTRIPMIVGSIFLVGVGITVLLYIGVLRNLTSNLDRMSETIIHLGQGHIDEPIAISGAVDFAPSYEALEITRSRLAAALNQMDQERADLDHFVYVASHDFKAPLRGIDNLAAWIEEDAGASMGAESREHLVLLRRRVKRLEALLDDLLAYSRAGRMKVPAETVDLADLLDGIVADLNAPVGMRVRYDGNLPVILSPKVPLEHVLRNLIANAVKHHDRPQGEIVVEAGTLRTGYVFRVIDDGPGIPARYRERIFELFQTLRPRDEIEGSGMGLAIAKRLVHGYNGAIRIVGPEGRGTTVEFTWYPEELCSEPENRIET